MKNTNTKNKKIFYLLFLVMLFLIPICLHAATTKNDFDYTPMEPLPGFESATSGATDFYDYILMVYKVAIWMVGISAMLMIIIGGYMYAVSAGNNSAMEKAKDVIKDAIIGLLMALSAWVILFVINPDLVKINRLKNISSNGAGGGGGGGGGNCEPMTTTDCAVSNLQNTCLASNAETMSRVCNKESGGNPALISGTDACADGNHFSIGLFQVNMITSADSIGCNGKDIFTTNGSGPQGTCLEHTTNSAGTTYCSKWDCKVINQDKYNECLGKLKNGADNITIACSLSGNGSNLRPWTTTKNVCGL